MTTPSLGRTILTYVIAGPPAGAVGFVGFMWTYELITDPAAAPKLADLPSVAPLIIAFGYLLGALPAVIASLVLAFLTKCGWGFRARLLASVPVGAAASWSALFWIIVGPSTGRPLWVGIVAFGFTGALAAIVSTFVLEAWPDRRGGNS